VPGGGGKGQMKSRTLTEPLLAHPLPKFTGLNLTKDRTYESPLSTEFTAFTSLGR
jgi:hypothetical protein